MSDLIPLVCVPYTIPPEKCGGQTTAAEELLMSVQAIDELPNGFAFRLPNETLILQRAATFMVNEQLCCPFFGFTLEIEPQNGHAWLKITGEEGVKDLLQAQFGIK